MHITHQAQPLAFLPLCLSALLLAGLSGCASQKQMQQVLDELYYLRGNVQTINRRLTDQQAALQQLQTILQTTSQTQKDVWAIEDSLQALHGALDQLRADVSIELMNIKEYSNYLNSKFDDLSNRSGKLIGKVESLTNKISDRTTSGAAASAGSTNPMELFNSAYLDMTRGNFQLAQQGFRAYLELFPNSDLADYCHFYLAEIAYQTGEYESAIAEYNTVIDRYPNSSRIPTALLKLGICYKHLNDTAKAQEYFRHLIQKYPNTEEAAQARAQL